MNRRMLRRLIAIILTTAMIVGLCPSRSTFADDTFEPGVTATATDSEENVAEDISKEDNTLDQGVIKEDNASAEGNMDKNLSEVSYPEFNPDPVTIDGVKVSVSAAKGVFPEGAILSVSKVSNSELNEVEETIEEERDDNEKVALSYTFDIKVLDKDGNELQPKDGAEVKVSFAANAIANENLSTNIYHVSGNTAEALPVTKDCENVATVETDGFSYYTVEFTYDEKKYVMEGDSTVALSEILDYVGIVGTPTAVSVSDESLFSASDDSGEWIVTAHQAFTSKEWMKVTVDGVEYEIAVTDEQINSTINSGATYIIDGSTSYNINIPSAGNSGKGTCVISNVYNGKVGNEFDLGNYTASSGFAATIDNSGNLNLKGNNFDLGSGYNAWRVDYTGETYYFYRAYVKSDQTWTISADDKTYTGDTKAGYTLNGTTYGTLTTTYSGRNDTTYNSATAPSDAGDYTVQVTYSGNDSYNSRSQTVDFSITKATNPLSFVSNQSVSKTFSTSNQTTVLTAATGGIGNVTYAINSQKQGSTNVNYFSLSGTTLTVAANTPAGAFTLVVRATAEGDNNYDSKTMDSTVTVTVSKRTVTPTAPTLTTGTLTYNGVAKTLANVGSTTDGGTMYYYVGTSNTAPTFSTSTWKTSIDTKVDSGTYYIFWYDYVSDTVNNNDTTTDLINSVQSIGSRTIGSATITVTALDQSYPYDGNLHGTAISATTAGSQTATIKYGFTAGNYNLTSTPQIKDVADSKIIYYQVTAPNHNSSNGSYELRITKTDPQVTAPTAKTGLTYNSNDYQNLITEGSTSGGTLKYAKGDTAPADDSSDWSTTIPSEKNAGTYKVWYKVFGDANYNDTVALSLDVTIARQSITPNTTTPDGAGYVTFVPDPVTYGVMPSISMKDAQGNVIPSSEYKKIIDTDDHQVTISDKLNNSTNYGNYDIDTETVNYTSAPGKARVLSNPVAATVSYDGSPKQLLVSGGAAEHGTMQYALGTKTEPTSGWTSDMTSITGTEVKDYYVWYKAAGDGISYTDSDAQYITVSIGKAVLTVTANTSEITYGDAPVGNGVTYSGFVGGDTASVIDETGLTYSFTYSKGGDVQAATDKDYGVYKIIPSGLSSDKYTFNYVQGDLHVNKKEVTITSAVNNKYYNGTKTATINQAQTKINGLLPGDALSIDYTKAKAEFSDKNAGTNKTVSYSGFDISGENKANYKLAGQPANSNATIFKEYIYISGIKVEDKVYDRSTSATLNLNNVVFENLVSGESLTITASAAFVDWNAGNSKDVEVTNIAIGGSYADNYELSSNTQIITGKITPKPLTITGIGASSKTYDGNASATITGTASLNGVIDGDKVSISAGSAAFNNKNAGTSKTVTFSGYGLTGENAGNYSLQSQPASVTADILPKQITVSGITALDKTYDANTNATLVYTGVNLSGIVSGDTLTVSATGTFNSIFAADEKPVTISGLTLDGASKDNYILATVGQQTETTAKISKKTLTITADSDSKAYDGSALTKNSYINTTLAVGDAIESVTVTGSQKNVGSSDNVAGAAIIKNGNIDVTNCYDITYAKGSLTVTEKAVTITADSDSKDFDNTPLTKNSYTTSGLASGDHIESITITGSQTAAGTSNNVPSAAIIKNEQNEDVTSNYTITYVNGTLTVNKANVTVNIVGNTDIKNYDGQAHTVTGYTATAYLTGETTITDLYNVAEDLTFSGTATATRTTAGKENMGLTAAQFTNVNTNFNVTFNVTDGYQKINKLNARVTIVGANDTKVYDGQAHTVTGYTATAYLEGETTSTDLYNVNSDFTFSGTSTATATNAGTVNMGLAANQFANINPNFETVTFEVTDGYQTISKKTVTITADSDSRVYDGTPLTKNTYTNTALVEGDSISAVTITGTQTNVGSSDNVPSAAVIKNASLDDVTANYQITYTNGTLTVTSKTVTVKADDKSKVYGDEEPALTVTVTGLVGTDTVDYTLARATGENYGEYIITPSGNAIQGNYIVTFETGKFNITKATLTITADDKSKTYGDADPELTYSVSGYKKDDTSTVLSGSLRRTAGANVGNYAINIGTLSAGNNYDISFTGATLTINPKAVTVKANDKSKAYGDADPTFDATVTGMVNGENASEKLTYNINRVAGNNVGTYTITPSGEAEQGNYSVTFETGTLTIGKKPLTVTASNKVITYGDAPTNAGVTYSAFAYTEDASVLTGTLSFAYSYEQYGNVGDYIITPSGLSSDNYDITFVNGKLTVEQKEVGIEWGETSFNYDSKPHLPTATATGLVNNDVINITVTGAEMAAGSYTATASELTGVKAGNYKLPTAHTTLFSIGKRALTIKAESDTKTYDGTPLVKNEYSVTSGTCGDNDSISSVTVTGSQTTAGVSDNVASAAVIMNGNNVDVTNNYDITYVNGTLTVNMKELTITAGSDNKVYDGTVLIKNSYSNTALATGDVIDSVTVTGSQLIAGTSNNVASAAVIKNGSGAEVTSSYDISYVSGTLEVTKKSVTITADSADKVYDGTALTKNSFTSNGLAAGDSIAAEDITITGTQTNVGKSDNVLSEAVIKNSNSANVTSSYNITYVKGELEVKVKPITITAGSDSKVYDGTPLIKDTYTNTDLAAGDSISAVTITGTQTNVGTSNNVPSAAVIKNASLDDVTANYQITYTNGTLTVTPKAVTVKADDKSKVYGDEDPELTATVTGLVGNDTVNYTLSRAKGDTYGEYIITPSGNATQGNYTVTFETGKFNITKTTLLVTADGKTKTYGDEDPALTYQVSGLKNGDTITGSLSRVAGNTVGNYAINIGTLSAGNNYEINYTGANLTIIPKSVIVKANDKSKIYGKSDPVYDATVTGMVPGENASELLSYSFIREVGDKVGNYKITPTGDIFQGNYIVSYQTGTLTINKKTLTVTANDNIITYGDAASNDGVTYTGFAFDEDESVLTGTLSFAYNYEQYGDIGSDYTITPSGLSAENYNLSFVDGKLTVEAKEVGIQWGETSFNYDGKSHLPTATITGLVNNDVININVTGAATSVGSHTATASELIGTKAGNYKLPTGNTTSFSIDALALTITASSDTKIYDGTVLVKNAYSVTSGNLAEGDEISSVTVTGSQITAGTSDNVASAAVIKNAKDEDVTANYNISYEKGTLTVNKKELTITADSDSKVYDGTVLTKNSYTNTDLATGDVIESVTVIGSQLIAGTSNNVASGAVIKNALGTDVTGSYDIAYVSGTLEVTKKVVTITADSDTKVYDGTALTKDSFTSDGLAVGDSIAAGDIVITGTQTNVGKSDNVASTAVIKNSNGANVTSSYDITYVKGELEVTPKAVIVKANDKTKTYGEADPTFDVTITGMVDGEDEITYTISRETGDNVGEYIISPSGNTTQGNYSVTYETGTLTIGKRAVTVTITGHNNSAVYDGNSHSISGYEVSVGDSLYSNSDIGFTGSNIALRTEVGTTVMGLNAEQFTNNNDNFDVTFTVTDGYQTIIKANNSVEVTINDWTYGKTAEEPSVNATFGSDEVVYTYYTNEACTIKTGTSNGASSEGGKPTLAGTYFVKAEIAETDNYNVASGVDSFAINKANIRVAADDKSSKYKNDIVELTWQISGDYIEGDELGITASTTATNNSVVGEYPITLSWNNNPNYSATIIAGTYTITKTDLIVSASAYSGVYDGEEHGITVDVDGNEEAVVYYSDTTALTTENYDTAGSRIAPTRKDVGVTTVYYYVSTGNYSPDPIKGSKDITITSAEVTVTADDISKKYGENDPKFTATITGLIEGDGEELIVYVLASEHDEEAGEYDITATGDEVQGNYTVKFVGGKFTIEKADQEAPDATTITVHNIEDEALVIASIEGVDDSMEYSTDGGETWIPVEDGQTTIENLKVGEILIRFKEDENHNAGTIITIKVSAKGDVEVSTRKIGDVPDITVSNSKEEMFDKLLDDTEKAARVDGKDVDFYLTEEDKTSSVSEADKKLVQGALKEGEVVGIYLDINLFKQIENEEAVQIHETNGYLISFIIKLPEKLINKDGKVTRSYRVLRIHNGVIEEVTSSYDSANESIDTGSDNFSIFVIVYKDAIEEKEAPEPAKDATVEDKTDGNTDIYRTGDDTPLSVMMLIMVLSLGGCGVVINKKRKKISN